MLGVSRRGYCQWRVRGPSARALRRTEFDAHVTAEHPRSRPTYGRPRLVKELNARGVKTGAERVRRSLVRQGLRPVYRRRWLATTDSAHRLSVAPNVLDRRFDDWWTATISKSGRVASGKNVTRWVIVVLVCFVSSSLFAGRVAPGPRRLSGFPQIRLQSAWQHACASCPEPFLSLVRRAML